jgi:ketosteroid isomerase-like protein
MSAELLIRKFFDAYNEGNATGMAELFSDEATVEYAGAVARETAYIGKKAIGGLFGRMVEKTKGRLRAAISCPKTLLVREDLAVVEWSSALSDKSGASFIARGVNVCEIEEGKFRKMTVYLPSPTAKPFALADKLTIKDLGELSLIAWAIV